MMKIVVAGMHRTGHHPVAIWLLHQQRGIFDFSINTLTQWLFLVQNGSKVSLLANNPLKRGGNEHKDKAKFAEIINDIKPSLLISTHERTPLTEVANACSESPVFSDQKPRLVIVLRDFRNWVASCVKMAKRDNKPVEEIISDDDIQTYSDHLYWYSPVGSMVFIKYNQWFTDLDYRKEITTKLGLNFTDACRDQLSIFGDGSSFDGMSYLKNATQMNVTERYKQMADDPDYLAILYKHRLVLEKSDHILSLEY